MIRSILFTALFALALTSCSEKPKKEVASETPMAAEETPSAIEKTAEKISDIEIVGDKSPATNDLTKAASEMTGGSTASE